MSLSTFSTGLSGLSTSSEALNVVGNNLANLNTIGYKSQDISFSDVLGQQFATPGTPTSGNIATIGLGAQVSGIRSNYSQGTVTTTGNPLDVAIQGQGFLVVDSSQGQYYTRAGNLQLDANGNLVSQSGDNVQGYMMNPATGKIDTSTLQSIKIPSGLANPVATSNFNLGMNLDSTAANGTQFSTSVQIFDSLGKPHVATITFQKAAGGSGSSSATWDFDITIPNNEVAGVASSNTQQYSLLTGGVAANPPAGGALVFDASGNLTSAYLGGSAPATPTVANLTIPPSGTSLPALADGAKLSSGLTWQLLDSKTGAGDITGFAKASAVSSSTQNGAAAGTLSSLSVLSDGTISAAFSNGTVSNIGQIALAQFDNVNGLVQQGGGLYTASEASGSAFIGTSGTAGRGTMLGGALEQSNVDLATELTKIITFQRSYQASAKIITATDQVMQDTINMKQ
jgi:flagellar hook protein FlgE